MIIRIYKPFHCIIGQRLHQIVEWRACYNGLKNCIDKTPIIPVERTKPSLVYCINWPLGVALHTEFILFTFPTLQVSFIGELFGLEENKFC